MDKETANRVAESFNVAGVEAHTVERAGQQFVVMVQDIVSCSSGGGRKWTEKRPLIIYSVNHAVRYMMDIS